MLERDGRASVLVIADALSSNNHGKTMWKAAEHGAENEHSEFNQC